MYHSYKFFTVIISVFVWTVKIFLAIMSTSGTVIPTDHHLHIYWWSDITHVLKSCLILVAWNSDFFWLSIWWMTTQLAAFDNPCLCWRKECSCLWSLFYKLCNSFLLLFLLSFKYFSTHKKNVYEQTTFYGVSVFSEMILWTKETFSFYSNASSSWISRCKVWKLGNIIQGIFLHIPQF